MTGHERREQLPDVGRALFADKGFEAVSVEEIAAKAGVSKPVVYEHFGGKEGLYAVLVDREMNDLLASISDALTAGTARALLEQAGMALFDYIDDNPEGFRILVRDSPVSQSSGSFASLIVDIAAQVEHLLARELIATTSAPSTRPCTPRHSWAWWRSPGSGGSMFASPGRTTLSPTWSTSHGTASSTWSPSLRCAR